MTALQSGQLASMSATRHAQFSQNLAWPHGTKAKPSIGANKLHNTVVVGLQQVALLEPLLVEPRSHVQCALDPVHITIVKQFRNCYHTCQLCATHLCNKVVCCPEGHRRAIITPRLRKT